MSTAPDAPSTAEFAFELVKLLLQVAWADDHLAATESNALLAFARERQLGANELALLVDCLAGRQPLPPPNLGLLKARRTEVMRAVKELLASDRHVAAEEEAILQQISALLR